MKAAVIGSPISHSLSPFIFSFIAHHEKIDVDYKTIEVKENQAKDFLETLRGDKEFYGTNVTIPLKEVFLDKIDSTSPEVKALGALNVLQVKDAKIKGFNTDIIGIQKTFEGKNFSLEKKRCLLLGAGGSAKAIAYVLGQGNVSEVIIFNRSERNAEVVLKFQNLFPNTKWSAIGDLNDPCLKTSALDLVINSTPLGMTGKDSGKSFFEDLKKLKFSGEALAFDLIYTPEETEFLEVAKECGLKTVGGLGMLIDQALATWKIWIGELKNEKELHSSLRDYLNGVLWLRANPMPIYLSGFMGVGKSTIGEILAGDLKREFLDTDWLIQKKAQLSIPEIFAQFGESEFRKIESEVIAHSAANEKSAVISLGGGALIKEENFKKLHGSGLVVYLEASKEKLLERIGSQKEERPLLANLSKEEQLKKISDLLSVRKDIYEKAPIRVQTDTLSLKECAIEILSAIGRRKGK